MCEGYHRLNEQQRDERDQTIISLVIVGIKHKDIAYRVGMAPAGVESRLQKLREEGKLAIARGRND